MASTAAPAADIDFFVSNSPTYFPRNESLALLLVALMVPMCLLFHSYRLHGMRMSPVRILSDTGALAQFLSALTFLSCKAAVCSRATSAYVFNVLSDCIFGGVLQACDFYLTYSRYADVVSILAAANNDDGATVTKLHSTLAVVFVVVLGMLTVRHACHFARTLRVYVCVCVCVCVCV
jgi:hypothetical protein